MLESRKSTKQVYIRDVAIGGGAPITVQSMTNVKTSDTQATVAQIKALEAAGCDIVRVAVLDADDAKAIAEVKQNTSIPIIADIHFDHRLALASIASGVDALRLNPGNIRDEGKVKEVVEEAKRKKLVIRVGVNSGSIDEKRFNGNSAEAMVQSAREHIELMEKHGFSDIKVSLKSSSVSETIEANRIFSSLFNYPVHLGLTEAGTLRSSLIKSSMGLGVLLLEGIGDTIRVSITGDPVEEVLAARMILKFSGRGAEDKVEIISCPTCGRTEFPIEEIATELERRCSGIKKKLSVAVMGCPVNGPGEAKHADLGIAGKADGKFLYFERGGKPTGIDSEKVVDFLLEKIDTFS